MRSRVVTPWEMRSLFGVEVKAFTPAFRVAATETADASTVGISAPAPVILKKGVSPTRLPDVRPDVNEGEKPFVPMRWPRL